MEPISLGRRLTAAADIEEMLAVAAGDAAGLLLGGIAVAALHDLQDDTWHIQAAGPSPAVAAVWAQRARGRYEKRAIGGARMGQPGSMQGRDEPLLDLGQDQGLDLGAPVPPGAPGNARSTASDRPWSRTWHSEEGLDGGSAGATVLEAEVDAGEAGSGLLALVLTRSGATNDGRAPEAPEAPPAGGAGSFADLRHGVATIAALTGLALRTVHLGGRLTAQERDQREQQQFLSLAAHDLRTPLAAIRGYAQLLLRQRNAIYTPLQRTGLETIIQQADRLAGLTELVLDVARIQTRRMPLRRTTADVGQIVRQAAGSLQASPYAPAIHVSAPAAGPLIQADIARLTQMAYGLLEFAVTRSDARHPVDVRVIGDGDGVLLVVEDASVVLEPEERDNLFRQLVVEAPEGTSPSLAPLGLYIVRGAAEAHGGRAWADSPSPHGGAGLRLSVWLPLQAQD